MLFQTVRTLPVPVRAAGRAGHRNPPKRNPSFMPRSLTNAQRRELQKVTRWVVDAETQVRALESQKRAKQEEIQRLRGRLGARRCAEQRGPCRTLIFKSPPDRCEDIGIARFQLQVIIDGLAEAQASYESTLRFKNYLKTSHPGATHPGDL